MKACNVVIWAGARHSGKTTTLVRLTEAARQNGISVGGFLAPSRYRQNDLVGFDIEHIVSGQRIPLALRTYHLGVPGVFNFLESGLNRGHEILCQLVDQQPRLAIVDEFGPLEIKGENWRHDVDTLMHAFSGLLLLVVRESCVPAVKSLYSQCLLDIVDAGDEDATARVLEHLREE